MSRDVLVSPRPPAATGRGRAGLALSGVALLGLALGAALVAWPAPAHQSAANRTADTTDSLAQPQFPPATGLTGSIVAVAGHGAGGRQSARQPVDRLQAQVVISNGTPRRRQILDVIVTGWGTTYVRSGARDAVAEAGSTARLPMTIIPDCAMLPRADLVVLVRSRDGTAEPAVERLMMDQATADPYGLLAGLCPRPVRGVSVTATETMVGEDGVLQSRLVNNGSRAVRLVVDTRSARAATGDDDAVRLVSTPDLPLTLAVGQSVTVRLRALVHNCTRPGRAHPRIAALAGDNGELTAISDHDGSFVHGVLTLALTTATRLCTD